ITRCMFFELVFGRCILSFLPLQDIVVLWDWKVFLGCQKGILEGFLYFFYLDEVIELVTLVDILEGFLYFFYPV
ncbi:MAG: hypothetical protein ACK4F9_07660, partial [Brevinematia bacterium]